MWTVVQSKIDEVAKVACVKVRGVWKQLSFCFIWYFYADVIRSISLSKLYVLS